MRVLPDSTPRTEQPREPCFPPLKEEATTHQHIRAGWDSLQTLPCSIYWTVLMNTTFVIRWDPKLRKHPSALNESGWGWSSGPRVQRVIRNLPIARVPSTRFSTCATRM